ncbi:MAG: CHAT domain-containing protein [Streptosporangiaceae bacterium]
MEHVWAGKAVGDLEVRAVAYHVSGTSLAALVVRPDGTAQAEVLGDIVDFLPVIDAVTEGLQRTTNVARGAVRALQDFAVGAGRRLLPRSIIATPPDVVIIIPHSVLHGVPLHLVRTDSGMPLCAVTGVSYAGSLSQFIQCAAGNPARSRALDSWLLGLEPAESARQVAGYCADVLDRDGTRFAGVIEAIESALGRPVLREGNRSSVKGHINPWNEHGPRLDALVMVAHGYIDAEDHQFSGLLMASADLEIRGFRGETFRSLTLLEDQPSRLYLREAPMTMPPVGLQIARNAEVLSIAELRMDALSKVPLVALFGCSAGWSRVLKGDVPSSLGETFLTLGSSAVIAPAWDADVTAVAAWAERFFYAWSRLGWPVALSSAFATRALCEDSWPAEKYGAITIRGDWL